MASAGEATTIVMTGLLTRLGQGSAGWSATVPMPTCARLTMSDRAVSERRTSNEYLPREGLRVPGQLSRSGHSCRSSRIWGRRSLELQWRQRSD